MMKGLVESALQLSWNSTAVIEKLSLSFRSPEIPQYGFDLSSSEIETDQVHDSWQILCLGLLALISVASPVHGLHRLQTGL